MHPADHFAPDYAGARARFLSAAGDAGLAVESRPHPLPGPNGEPLALDVALDGDAGADALLILSSACHGVEGFCGSGVQVAALRDAAWRRQAREAGVAVLHLHALNPWGFAHLHRVTQENVDLNRNFQPGWDALPVNPAYAELHPHLLPEAWPPSDAHRGAIERFIAERGMDAYQAGVSQGQHTHPDGMYFGGTAPTWSNTTLRTVLRQHAQRARRIGWIDFHTGLGPNGVGERIFAARNDAAALARARAWWGGGVTSFYDGSSTSVVLTGVLFNVVYDECPQADYTGIALEFGTQPLTTVFDALRADHWLLRHPEAPAAQAAAIRRQMRDAFYTDTPEWKARVWQQAREAIGQAVGGLAQP